MDQEQLLCVDCKNNEWEEDWNRISLSSKKARDFEKNREFEKALKKHPRDY